MAEPAKPTNYAQSAGSITALAAQIRSGEITPARLVQGYLDRIAEIDPAVEAWISERSDPES